jgi:hypothetical protein
MFDCLDSDGSCFLEEKEVIQWVKAAYMNTGALLDLITSELEALSLGKYSREVLGAAALGQYELQSGSHAAVATNSTKRTKMKDSTSEYSSSRRLDHVELAKEIFERMDLDGDGRVSFIEFYTFIMTESDGDQSIDAFQELLKFTRCFIERRTLVVDKAAAARMIAHALSGEESLKRGKGSSSAASLATPAEKKVKRCQMCTKPAGSPSCRCFE